MTQHMAESSSPAPKNQSKRDVIINILNNISREKNVIVKAITTNMCFVNLTPGRKTIIIFLLVLLSITSKVHSKCGCHRVPGQGQFY